MSLRADADLQAHLHFSFTRPNDKRRQVPLFSQMSGYRGKSIGGPEFRRPAGTGIDYCISIAEAMPGNDLFGDLYVSRMLGQTEFYLWRHNS